MKTDRAIKIIASVCFILIVVALFAIRGSPATGYESSIYWATPPVVWGCLIFSIACGIGIVVHHVFRQKEDNNLWVIGLGLILLSNTIILSLHILRGYAFWAAIGDPGAHLSITQDIIASGHIEESNFYPITHIYLAQLSQLLGVRPMVLLQWMPVLFALLSMGFTYFLVKSILPRKGQVMLATVAGTALISGWYLYSDPNVFANLAFPLTFYLLVRSFAPGTLQWKFLFLIIVFLLPPFHPVPTFALLAIMLGMWLFQRLSFLLAGKVSRAATSFFRLDAATMLILFVWGFTWLSSFAVWDQMTRNLRAIILESGITPYAKLMGELEYAGVHGYSVAEQFFKLYSGVLVYIILAVVALAVLRKRLVAKGDLERLGTLYGSLGLIALAMVALYFTGAGFDPRRLLVYILIICIPFSGFVLFEFINQASSQHKWLAGMAPLLVAVLIISVSLHGIAKIYPSPYVLLVNHQTTQTEIDGMDWFLHNKNTSIPTSVRLNSIGGWARISLTSDERQSRQDIPLHTPEKLLAPYHFGYDKHSTLGQSYDGDTYLIMPTRFRKAYVETWPEIAELRFLPEDFAKLEADRSVDKLYSNSGLDVYYIHSEGGNNAAR